MSTGNEDLSDFLDSQSNQGTRIDGDESFTVSPEKAWEKLTVHALPFSEAWVLELVRGAVLCEASEIALRQQAEYTEIVIVGDTPWDREGLIEALFGFQTGGSPGLHHLAIGLRVLAKVQGNSYTVSLGSEVLFTWDGTTLSVVAARDGGVDEVVSTVMMVSVSNSSLKDRSFFSKLLNIEEKGFVAAVSRLLHSRAFGCPIPLSVDGRPVRGLHAHPDWAPSQSRRPLFHFQVPVDEHLPTFRLVELSSWEQLDEESPVHLSPSSGSALGQAWQRSEGIFEETGAVVLISAFLSKVSRGDSFMSSKSKSLAWGPGQGTSKLMWLQDGVIVDEESLNSGAFAMLMVASAEGLKTDISGYKIVQNEAYEERRNRVLSRVASEVLRVLGSDALVHTQELGLGGFDIVTRAMMGVIGMGFIIPGLLFFGDLAYGFSSVRKLAEECEGKFRSEYSRFLQYLNVQSRVDVSLP